MWSGGRHRGEEKASRASRGSRVIKASEGFLTVFDFQHSTISMGLMSSCYWLCVFSHSWSSRLPSNPQGAKVENSSTCINRCLVSPTSISAAPHLLHIWETNSGEDFIEVCVDCLDNVSFSSLLQSLMKRRGHRYVLLGPYVTGYDALDFFFFQLWT